MGPAAPGVTLCLRLERSGRSQAVPSASGGIGRRARFRSVCPKGRGGSTPPSRTNPKTPGQAPPDREFCLKQVASDQSELRAGVHWQVVEIALEFRSAVDRRCAPLDQQFVARRGIEQLQHHDRLPALQCV